MLNNGLIPRRGSTGSIPSWTRGRKHHPPSFPLFHRTSGGSGKNAASRSRRQHPNAGAGGLAGGGSAAAQGQGQGRGAAPPPPYPGRNQVKLPPSWYQFISDLFVLTKFRTLKPGGRVDKLVMERFLSFFIRYCHESSGYFGHGSGPYSLWVT